MNVILFEDLVSDPVATMQGVFSHIGLELPDDPTALTKMWFNKQSLYPRFRRLHVRLGSWCRHRLGDMRLSARLVRRVGQTLDPLTLRRGRPVMDKRIERELAVIYRDSNQRLVQWLRRKFPWITAD